MHNTKSIKAHILFIATIMTAMLIVVSSGVYAVSVPDATGQINSYDGAILRKSSSTSSAQLAVLTDNTGLTIHREVFKKSSSTAKKNKWYYVTADGTEGYVRADLVDHIRYSSVKGKTKAGVNYRKGAGTGMKLIGSFDKGAKVTVVLKARPVKSAQGSCKTWYKIKYGKKYYYVCSSKIKLTGSAKTVSNNTSEADDQTCTEGTQADLTDNEFEEYLKKEGFPASYRKKLRELHKLHPNWSFTAYQTDIPWSAALKKQTSGSTSLVSGSMPKAYRDGSKQYEKGWYKADKRVVAHYLDPRNFLNENAIYMFDDLTYKPKYQTASVVKAILSPTKLPSYGFTAKIFINAGEINNVSPVFLASRARQETGSGGDAVNGTKVLGKKVYNPFNIGAYGGNPLYKGLLYAYGKGWTTPAKAVKGGAAEMAKNYISQGQNTVYYQRFNVRNGENKVGTHQYMTNIMAPYCEAVSARNSYVKYGIIDMPMAFEIPVYKGMPASTKLP
jgi:beta-N-acetylglucosaminidase/uncharacterized protein YgiM (DUF1202 family)